MLYRDWTFRIKHILEAIEDAEAFVRGMSYDTFRSDKRTVRAVLQCFGVIGEAARCVPASIREARAEVPWNKMIRMRNVMIHEYDVIDLEIVWDTLHKDLPSLVGKLRTLLREPAGDNAQ